jgi:hypothetical protein
MTQDNTGRRDGLLIGGCVGILLFLAGASVVLSGWTAVAGLSAATGVLAAVAALLYFRSRQKPAGFLCTAIAAAALVAIAGTAGVAVAADAIVHSGGLNPGMAGQPAPVQSGPVPWAAPDADLLGRDLNDTAALLTLPVGGFENGRLHISFYNPEDAVNYTLVTRNMTPGTVELRVYPAGQVRVAGEHAPWEGIGFSIIPDHFEVAPGMTYTAQFRVNLTPGMYNDTLQMLPYYIQVRSVNEDRVIADDWALVYAGDAFAPGVGGFYHGHASLDDAGRELNLTAGETGTATYVFRSGIGGTGQVRYNLSLISGTLNMMPMPEEEKRPFPPGMRVTISPDNFMARSFGYYPSVITVATDPDLAPGDYHVLIEADDLGTNDQFVVRMNPPQGTAAGGGRPCRSNEEWHTKAGETGAWRDGFLVPEGTADDMIHSLVQEYAAPASPDIRISAPHYIGYYVSLTETENRTMRAESEERYSEWNLSFSSPMFGFTEPSVKPEGENVIAPVFLLYNDRMNETQVFDNLVRRNVSIRRANVVTFDLSGTYTPQERDRLLGRLNADDRVLFVFREYLEGVLC